MNPFMSIYRQQRRGTRSSLTSQRRAGTVREWPLSGGGFPWHKVSFGWTLNGDQCTIYAGKLRVHAVGKVSWSTDTVTLLAETCTVYAECAKHDYSSPGDIKVSATPPDTSDSHYRFPLYTFTYDSETETYETPPDIHHFLDVQLDTPVM